MSDTFLTRCPACHHALAVPVAFRGKVVSCVQCRAVLTAPAADGEAAALVRYGKRKLPAMVIVPLFGLLTLGAAGVGVNGYLYWQFGRDPEAAKEFARWMIRQQAADKPAGKPDGDARKQFHAEQDAKTERMAADVAPFVRDAQLPFLFVSLGVLAGGVAFAAKKPYWLAFVGCGLAAVNVNHACCFPGAIAGAWGFFFLISDEGRRYFHRG